ncbi:MAG: DNA-binding protein [Candidatus Methanosuratincola petrocarbonis]
MASDSDDEIEIIKKRKLLEMERRLAAMKKTQTEAPKKVEEDPLSIVKRRLIGRGPEVLEAALSQYPQAAMEVVKYIANLYRTGKLREDIPGEDLYELFCNLGMPVRLETSITYIKDGKRVPLSQKFKGKGD